MTACDWYNFVVKFLSRVMKFYEAIGCGELAKTLTPIGVYACGFTNCSTSCTFLLLVCICSPESNTDR